MKPSSLDLTASFLAGMPVAKGTFPRHSWRTWGQALARAVYLVAAFDSAGSVCAREKLHTLSLAPSPFSYLPHTVRLSKAQQDIATLRVWLRLFSNGRACFSESIALCGGMRALGWNCEVVIGVAHVHMRGTTDMHAWIEYEGEAIGDPLEIPLGYTEIERFGRM